MHTTPLHPMACVLILGVALMSAVYDFQYRRIPNWVTLPGIVLGVALNGALAGTGGLWMSAQGLGLALLVYGSLYLARALGAGDVKLMAAVGAATGPTHWFRILLLTAIAGGIAALTLIVLRGRVGKTFANIGTIIRCFLEGQAPFREDSSLDVRKSQAMRMAHGIVIGFAVSVYVIYSLAF